MNNPAAEFLLMLGDERLVLGHRLSEWCGHAPELEEDIALANIALDLIGQAVLFLREAGQREGKGRDEDDLAYFRDAREYRNCNLVEYPNGDFGFTILRQFLFDAYSVPLLKRLSTANNQSIAAPAAKALKEDSYHLLHSREWVIRLGDGTEESAARIGRSLETIWHLTGELFAFPPCAAELSTAGAIPSLEGLHSEWIAEVSRTFAAAKLQLPAGAFPRQGGRAGIHSEHLGHLLAEMQILPRTYPDAKW